MLQKHADAKNATTTQSVAFNEPSRESAEQLVYVPEGVFGTIFLTRVGTIGSV